MAPGDECLEESVVQIVREPGGIDDILKTVLVPKPPQRPLDYVVVHESDRCLMGKYVYMTGRVFQGVGIGIYTCCLNEVGVVTNGEEIKKLPVGTAGQVHDANGTTSPAS